MSKTYSSYISTSSDMSNLRDLCGGLKTGRHQIRPYAKIMNGLVQYFIKSRCRLLMLQILNYNQQRATVKDSQAQIQKHRNIPALYYSKCENHIHRKEPQIKLAFLRNNCSLQLLCFGESVIKHLLQSNR